MKKLLLLSIILLMSCSQQDASTQSADCNCDRVKEYNVSESCITHILNNTSWKEISIK